MSNETQKNNLINSICGGFDMNEAKAILEKIEQRERFRVCIVNTIKNLADFENLPKYDIAMHVQRGLTDKGFEIKDTSILETSKKEEDLKDAFIAGARVTPDQNCYSEFKSWFNLKFDNVE